MIDPTAREGVELGQIPELAEGRWHGPLHCPDPEEILLRRERRERLVQYIRALLGRLSTTNRDVLLAWARGHVDEYRTEHELTRGAFNTRVCRAKARLAEVAEATRPPREVIRPIKYGR